MSAVLDLSYELIRRASVTPNDAGCQDLLAERLVASGFAIERLRMGDVENLWATHGDAAAPTLMLLGHTDVVPSGPVENWASAPFEPVLRDGKLYGRGAADMKGSVAAFVLALEQFVAECPDHPGRVGMLLTSDEEGPALDGVRKISQLFRERGERIDWCLVGEPSSRDKLADVIRVGRRGSLSARLTVCGVQGHVAYADQARNPIHEFSLALAELVTEQWDSGNADFPPTTFQVSNIHAGTGANNVIPGVLRADCNFRYSSESSDAQLRARTEAILEKHGLDWQIDWHDSGQPFLSSAGGKLRKAVLAACHEQCGTEPEQSTAGGASDGRFIAPLGVEVVELGPVNASIHQVDEHVAFADLERLPALYLAVIRNLLG